MTRHSSKEIGETNVEYFLDQVMEDSNIQEFTILDYIPKLVEKEENERMIRLLRNDEVKKVVFDLSGDSTYRPDGFL